MSIQKPERGTRGARQPRLVVKLMMPLMRRIHRLTGDRLGEVELLYLTTVGARSGQRRTSTVARFDDGAGGWWVVASFAGSASHPAWYHNIVAHPDQVWAEVSGVTRQVSVEQLEGEARDAAWAAIVARSPRFDGYRTRTDRLIPVLRLTPVPPAAQ